MQPSQPWRGTAASLHNWMNISTHNDNGNAIFTKKKFLYVYNFDKIILWKGQ